MAKVRIELNSWRGDSTWVDWDPERGTLSGPAARELQEMCDEAVSRGTVISHPYPTGFDISDPLHDHSEMAVVISQFYRVPTVLQEHYPKVPSSSEDVPWDIVY